MLRSAVGVHWRRVFQRGVIQLSQPRAAALVIFALALALRVTYNLTLASDYIPTSDALEYNQLARNLLQWHCYCFFAPGRPTAYRPPLFPLFLAGVYLLGGANPLYGRLALSVVGALTCVLVSIMARDLFGPRVGLLAGLIAATYPQLFIYDAWLYSESLAICLFAASCLAMMRASHNPPGWQWLLVGVLLGLTALTRPNGIYALLAVLAWVALAVLTQAIRWKRATIGSLLILLGCLVVMLPWTIRNASVTNGAFVPISTGGGIVLAGAYNDSVVADSPVAGFWVNPLNVPADQAVMLRFPPACWSTCEVARDQAARNLGIAWATSHLQDIPLLVWNRMIQFWTPAMPPIDGGLPEPLWPVVARTYPATIICLALLGLLRLKGRGLVALLPCFFGATVILGGILFYGSVRLRAPLEPFLVVLASGAIGWLVTSLRQRRSPETARANSHQAKE